MYRSLQWKSNNAFLAYCLATGYSQQYKHTVLHNNALWRIRHFCQISTEFGFSGQIFTKVSGNLSSGCSADTCRGLTEGQTWWSEYVLSAITGTCLKTGNKFDQIPYRILKWHTVCNYCNYCQNGGTAVAQWLRCCDTNRKVAGSIPAGVIGFFNDIKTFRSHYGPGVGSASNRNEYQEHFLGVKAAGE